MEKINFYIPNFDMRDAYECQFGTSQLVTQPTCHTKTRVTS